MPFGDLLRTAREERGLSQSEVGGDRYSASYISYLERGKRRPTPELVEYLARQLRLPATALTSPARETVSEAQLELAVDQVRIHDALLRRDYASVITGTERAAIDAAALDTSIWWTALRLHAEALILSGDYEGCLTVVDTLLDSPLPHASAQLRASALALRARALRASGNLPESLAAARRAVASAIESGNAESLVTALLGEVAAHGELGHRAELIDSAERLASACQGVRDGHLRGLASWSLGNVHFLTGNIERAVAEHDEAAAMLKPESDLRAWARFHKASAAMRMAAGVDEGVDFMLELAGQGLAIVGNEEDRAELQIARAERLLKTKPNDVPALIRSAVEGQALPPHTQAEARSVEARALELAGDQPGARAAWATAADLYAAAGAHDRTAGIWRYLAGASRSANGRE